jgi:SAM-dependent methyltransferase
VLEVADALPRGRALDVPCGPGLAAEALRRLGFRVVAADLDARAFAPNPDIPFQRLDLEQGLPFADASFELVHCGDGIEHLENPMAALRELARVLGPGGTLVLTTPNYLSLERRLRFLLTGSLAKPLPRTGDGSQPRGHVSPLTLTQLAWMAERAGLRLAQARTLLPQPRQRLLAPLALPIAAYARLLPPRRRRDLFAEHSGSLSLLLGGRKLLLVLRRPAASGAAAAASASASLLRMQQVEVERRFDAPPERVWQVYTDHARWSEWAGFGRSWLEQEGRPDRNGTGAVRGFASGGVRVYEEVLSFEPPKRMTYRVLRGGLPLQNHFGEVVFEPDGAGTRVVWRCRFESKLPGLGAPMRWFVARVFRKALAGLARRGFAA